MKKLAMLIVCSTICLGGLTSCNDTTVKSKPTQSDTVVQNQVDTFALTQENVYKMLCSAKIEHPKIVLRQVVLETGHFKSNACINKHNLFGFMDRHGVRNYKTVKESIDTYRFWQHMNYDSKKYPNYYDFLENSGYCEDSAYVDTLKKIKIHV